MIKFRVDFGSNKFNYLDKLLTFSHQVYHEVNFVVGTGTDGIFIREKIFRHGERTTITFYPKDPYQNITFYPYGLGALTNKGKLMMFKLGERLRSTYGNLLGKDYTENKMMVRSTGVARTLLGASLVLAGLFPPSEKLKWHPNLMWQPIPVFSKPIEEEDLLTTTVCPARETYLSNLSKNSSIYNVYVKPYKDLMDYVKYNSGLNVTDLRDIFLLHSILKAEVIDCGLTLPTWTKKIFPKTLHETASLMYEYINSYPVLKQIHAGYFLQKIINDTIEKVNHKQLANERKMFIYSGHESTIANLLYLLKVFKPLHIPQCGSTILFELRKQTKDYYIMVKYLPHPTANITALSIPGCSKLCPAKRFVELYNEFLPEKSYKATCETKV